MFLALSASHVLVCEVGEAEYFENVEDVNTIQAHIPRS